MTKNLKIRTSTETTICEFCHRGLLRGERSDTFYLHNDSKLVCELCQTTALRAGWRRDAPSAASTQHPTTTERGGLLDRLRGRSTRDRVTPEPLAPRDHSKVKAEPTGSVGRIRTAVESFNGSEYLKTISSVGHSLGDPTFTAVDLEGEGVDLVAAWDLCWYRWRVEIGQGGVSILEAGRGYELAELSVEQRKGNLLLGPNGQIIVP